jgi:hypothetical protein
MRADLELLLESPQPAESVALPDRGTLIEWAGRLEAADCPALAGIEALSLEGVAASVELCQALGGRLCLGRGSKRDAPEGYPATVSATSTLGNICGSGMIVWVGCDGASSPIGRFISRDQLLGSFVEPTLEAVLRLRRAVAEDFQATPFAQHPRVGVVLGPDVDPQVASQWHRLAWALQDRQRVGVFQMPQPWAANRRGAREALLWRCGLDPAAGSVDFSFDPPRIGPSWPELVDRGGIDALIDVGAHLNQRPEGCGFWLAIRPDPPQGCDAPFTADGLRWGIRARAMRCDGLSLRLCEPGEPNAIDDPVALTLQRLRQALKHEL